MKVFRTPTGFHDAYVAAPSRKAALAAWGSDADLFARGVAEEVTDPALMAEPLAHPGDVVRRSRGSAAEQLAAVPDRRAARRSPRKAPSPATPKPSPADVDAADLAIEDMQRRHRTQQADLSRRQAELTREQRALTKAQTEETERLEAARAAARRAYDAALRTWRG